MGKRILGLDLGTNSIGWAVVDEVGNGQFELVKRGVHIFQEGVKIEKGNESSKAAERTKYRSARRLKFRRKLRKIETLMVLSEFGYCPKLSREELKAWQSKKVYPSNPEFRDWCRTFDPKDKNADYDNPYYYRWLAATTVLNLTEEEDRFKLGRAFYHMAQRRGFKSNRLESTRESDGVVTQDISELSEKMGNRTLGQYFWEECYKNGKLIRKVHTSRDDHYLKEFNMICDKQGIPSEIKERLHRAIFFQRPLKSQKGLVANCPFEPKKKRAPISHPLFEEFRMLQVLNNIKIKTMDDVHLRLLTPEEKELVRPLFFRVSKAHFDFKDIAKKLTPKNQNYAYEKGKDAAEAHVLFNYSDNQSLSGCPLSAKLMTLFGDDFIQRIYDSYCGDKKGQKTPEDVVHEVWHVLYSFDDAEKVKEYAKHKLGMDEGRAGQFAKINPAQGYGALSLKAIRKILPFLRQGLIYSHAVFFANLDQVIGISIDDRERLRADIERMIDEHKQYIAQAHCVNELVRDYRESPFEFGQKYDLCKPQDLKLPSELRTYAQDICAMVKTQIRLNNDNGEYLPVKRLEERVGDYLIKEFGVDTQALTRLYHPSKEETYKAAERAEDGKFYLGDPRISSIRNPVFMRAMHRVKAVVNELLKQGVITDQTQVHLEMARELNDANKRAAIRAWQRNNETDRKKYKGAIEEELKAQGIDREATDDEILKYQLWEEQKHICPYTGKTIGLRNFIGENPSFDIEHTVPRSLCCDNSQENKTLCDREYNRTVKKKRIPYNCPDYAEILQRVEHWKVREEELTKLIERQKPKSKFATTKEAKDSAIQKRLVWEFERDYMRGKYRRFTMEEVTGGFKNSQLVDTRIITKYARMYLKTVFANVHTINGQTTDDFRRCWGVEKTRDNHAHHTVDAIVAACATREQYDALARYYHDYESYELNDPSVPKKPHFDKPWDNFTEDMKELKNQILVSHYAPNHLLKQTRKRGEIHGRKILQQGKTARGALHQDTFYGAIKRMEEDKKTGVLREATRYVVRKTLADLSDADLGKIVDDRVRDIAVAGREKESRLKKEIETLKKKPTSDTASETHIQVEINELERQLQNLYTLPNKNGSPIPIKKVRVYSNLTNPIVLKEQRDRATQNRKLNKEQYLVGNAENYSIVIYEGVGPSGKLVRAYRAFSNFSVTNAQKTIDGPSFEDRFFPIEKNGVLLKYRYEMRPGIPVLFCGGMIKSDLAKKNQSDLNGRLYYLYGIKGDDGRSKFRFHQESRLDKEQEAPGSDVDVDNPVSKVWISASRLDVLVGGVDFRLNVLGDVAFIEQQSC